MKFIRKYWSNILIVGVILLLTFPQTRTFISTKVNQLLASSPAEVSEENQRELKNYHWRLEDAYGKWTQLSESKGKVVFINFWATWCPPCIAEMPDLNNLYKQYNGKVDFYFVAQDEPEKVAAFMKKNDYDFPVYFAKANPPKEISSPALPTTYVISKNGKIVFDKTGAANWDSDRFKIVLERLLEE